MGLMRLNSASLENKIMTKNKTITVKSFEIALYSQNNEDFISLTDMARFKNVETIGLVISHWLSTRYSVKFMGLRGKRNNPHFNVTEFSNSKMKAAATVLYYLQNNEFRGV